LILSILGWAASKTLNDAPDWLLSVVAGLAAAGIALVASAGRALLANVCKGRDLQVIAVAATVVAFYWPKPWTFPALIVLGGLITLFFKRKEVFKIADIANDGVTRLGFGKVGGGLLLAVWAVVLVATVVAAGQTAYEGNEELHWFAAFYRTGSIIFGGGQVVLPMLFNDVVSLDCSGGVVVPPASNGTTSSTICVEAPGSWMSADEFYAGLALAQAMPGPLFNFAAYLGKRARWLPGCWADSPVIQHGAERTGRLPCVGPSDSPLFLPCFAGAVVAQNAGVFPITGIALCWVGLFAPGILIIFGILPYWGAFRRWQVYRRALPGLNAAAVGLVLASVFQLSLGAYSVSPFPTTSVAVGIVAYGATDVLGIPAPAVVLGGGVLGVIAWAANMK
jgi:chromate transporter